MDHFLFLDIHCSDCSNEPTILNHHRAKYSKDQNHVRQFYQSFEIMYSFTVSYIHIIGRGLGIRFLHSFLQIVEKISRNSYYNWQYRHMTPPVADSVAKTCSGNFVLSPLCSLAWWHAAAIQPDWSTITTGL